MINIKAKSKGKSIIKLKKDEFIDTNALYTQNKFSDGVAEVNNISGFPKNKIELPEEFIMKAEPKKIINEQIEYLKNQKPIKLNDKKALKVQKRIEKEFKVDSTTSDRLDHEIYKYELQVTKEKNHANSLFDDIVNRTQQYIKLFNGMASNSIFQNLVGLVARTIAPPPTENEILMIKERIKRLDPKLITDVYVISQIVQSPELLAYLKSLYDHVKNNVQNNKDLEYILNIVKSVTDYISVNSDKFSMMSSPWLMEAYEKIKGVVFSSPIFAPNTATPAPITTAPTTFNFQSDSTASPTERHTEAPTQTQTTPAPITSQTQTITAPITEPIPQYNPENMISTMSTPEHRHQLGTATPHEITRDLQYIMNKFNEAFTTNIETMKTLYFQIIDKSDPILNKFIALYDTLTRLDKLYDFNVELAPSKLFIINLFNALNNLNYPVLNDFKQIIRAKSDQIINSPNYNVSGAIDITPLEGFTPINYIRITPQPQPTTITKPYDVKPTDYIQSIQAPQYIAQPTIEPQIQPTPQNIGALSSNIKASKVKPSIIKVKINKNQAIKIIETIINNSTNTTELKDGFSYLNSWFSSITPQTIENIKDIGLSSFGVVSGIVVLYYLKKHYSKKVRPRYELLSPDDEGELENIQKIMAVDANTDVKISMTTKQKLIEMALRSNISPIYLFTKLIDWVRDAIGYGSIGEVQAGLKDIIKDQAIQEIKEEGIKIGEEKMLNIQMEKAIDKQIEIVEGFRTHLDRSNTLLLNTINNINKIGLSNIKSSLENFIKFYTEIQGLTSTLMARFSTMGLKASPHITQLVEYDTLRKTTVDNYYINKNFRTIIIKLESIIRLTFSKNYDDNLLTQDILEVKGKSSLLTELISSQNIYKTTLMSFLTNCINALKNK